MILDDEAPVLFVIPRKTDVSKNKRTVQAKTSKESLPAEPPLQTEADVNDQQGTTSKRSKAQTESGKKQPRGNRGKASKKKGKDAVPDVLEKITNSVPGVQEEGVGEQISPQNDPGLKDVNSSGKLQFNFAFKMTVYNISYGGELCRINYPSYPNLI